MFVSMFWGRRALGMPYRFDFFAELTGGLLKRNTGAEHLVCFPGGDSRDA